MPSESRDVREKQLEAANAELAAYKKTMDEGVTDKLARKDAVYRSLAASVKKARKRIIAMDQAIAHVEAMKEKDTKAEKSDKPKKKAAPVDDGGKKKKPAPKKKKK